MWQHTNNHFDRWYPHCAYNIPSPHYCPTFNNLIESGSSEPQTYRPCPAQGVAPMWFPIPSSNDHILSSILLSQTNEGKLGMQMRGRLKLNRNGEDKTHAEAKPQAKTDPCACFGWRRERTSWSLPVPLLGYRMVIPPAANLISILGTQTKDVETPSHTLCFLHIMSNALESAVASRAVINATIATTWSPVLANPSVR